VSDFNEELLDKLSEGALSDPCLITNPKLLTKDEVKQIYGEVLRKK
jgi:alcohol dehydrogenase class IV